MNKLLATLVAGFFAVGAFAQAAAPATPAAAPATPAAAPAKDAKKTHKAKKMKKDKEAAAAPKS